MEDISFYGFIWYGYYTMPWDSKKPSWYFTLKNILEKSEQISTVIAQMSSSFTVISYDRPQPLQKSLCHINMHATRPSHNAMTYHNNWLIWWSLMPCLVQHGTVRWTLMESQNDSSPGIQNGKETSENWVRLKVVSSRPIGAISQILRHIEHKYR